MEDTQYNKRIIIIGAGGMARELESWANIPKSEISILGFLDDNLSALDAYDLNTSLLGKIDLSNINQDQSILFGIMNSDIKRDLFLKAKENQISINHFLHSTVLVGDRTTFGIGLIAFPNAIISCDVTIGDLVFINCGTQIGHDVKIGSYTSIMANVDIGGDAEIGENVFIGSNAVILPGVKIPDNTRIGAGAVVMRKIKEPGTYFGNPAKKIF